MINSYLSLRFLYCPSYEQMLTDSMGHWIISQANAKALGANQANLSNTLNLGMKYCHTELDS